MTFTIFQTVLLYLLPLVALAINIRYKKGWLRMIVLIHYLLLICLRWQVGIDFAAYVRWIRMYGYLDFHLLNEPLSIGLVKLSGRLACSRLFFLIIPPAVSLAVPFSLDILSRILRHLLIMNNYAYLLTESANAELFRLNPLSIGLTTAVSIGVFLSIKAVHEDDDEYDENRWFIGILCVYFLVLTGNMGASRLAIAYVLFGIPVFIKQLYRKNVLAVIIILALCAFGIFMPYPSSCFPYNTRKDVQWNSFTPLRHK